MAPGKRKCKLTDDLLKDFPFIKKSRNDFEVFCGKCSSQFSIASGGRHNITRHLNSEKHKKFVKSAASSSEVTNYFRKIEFGHSEQQLAISKAIFAYHTVQHNHSFKSMDCTTDIIQKLFEKKFTCKRKKQRP